MTHPPSAARRGLAQAWRRVRIAFTVAGLFSGLALKGISHALIALHVPGARDLLHVAHVLIAVIALYVVGQVAYRAIAPRLRQRRAARFVEAAMASPDPSGGLGDDADRTVAPLVASGLVPGAIAGVIAQAQPSTHPYGRARDDSAQPPTERTRFELGSLTKVFTATLLAEMVDRGEVTLEARLGDLLPEVAADGPRAITLLDLATHRSGLPRLQRSVTRALVRRSLAHEDPRADPYTQVTAEQLVHDVGLSRGRTPGERFHYSNFGFALLGLALSRAAGAPYEKLIVDRICGPLGMQETGFEADGQEGRSAQGHDDLGKPSGRWHWGAMAPAGGLSSTAADMLRFAQAALSPERTSLEQALAKAQEPRRPAQREAERIGLAWLTRSEGDRAVVWHNGGTGGFGTFLGLDPGGPAAVTILGNAAHARLLDEAGFALLARAARA